MSHELRTPLNSLLILARELVENPEENLTEAQVKYATVIHSSGSDLLRLLNDILDLAKVESGTISLEISELPLVELQQALEADFRRVAEQKDLGFAVELAADMPATIATDPGRVRQVLKNLLSNAFKFTERGAVNLRIDRPDDDWTPTRDDLGGADDVISLSVADSGIGVSSEMQRAIFDAFAQGDGSTAREYGGTGLGLSISRELVQRLGGEMTLVSALGKGSTFTVYLPIGSDEKRRPQPDLEGRSKALVVDDNLDNIFALTTLLERGEFEVVSAHTGAEAVAIAESTPDIDIALVDIMMPVMDGYATMRAIHALPGRESLPIVALTANVASGERERCLAAGATAYVSKPLESSALLAVLRDCLDAPVLPVLVGQASNGAS